MKGKVVLPVFMGLFTAVCCYFIFVILKMEYAFLLSLVFGGSFAVILFPVLIIIEKRNNKKYRQYEESFSPPIFYKTTGKFDFGTNKAKYGNIYFCETGIVCICLDTPHMPNEIFLEDIKWFRFDNMDLTILTIYDQTITITMPDAQKVSDILKEKGWV